MANIEKRVTKDGRRVYKFRCLVGKDARGKQKFEYTTWKPPEGLTAAKEKKLAEAEAYRWEQELKHGGVATGGEYTTPLPEAQTDVQSANIIPDEETFRYFTEEIWMPLKVVGGGLRPSTISMYGFMLKVMIPKLGDKRLTEISGVDIMRYLQYLRDEYKAPDGRTLSEKSVKHHFNILRNIFNYAERQEYIEKNPIKKVDPPKLHKRPVDALSQEQARIFFDALKDCKLEYRCMMLLMATTGIRRGECLGLQWHDFM